MDVDFDISPAKREDFFNKIREDRGGEFGCVQVCTYGTVGSRSAVLNACRGYRSAQYPNGIDNDVAQYISSLIPSERGFTFTISDMIDGNEEKGRQPNKTFINEVSQYPGLLEIIRTIEGVIDHVGVHASGIVLEDCDDSCKYSAFMRAPSGTIVTQFSLHDDEYLGETKVDSLITEEMEIIGQTIQLLQKYGYFDSALSLREAYYKYVSPDVLPMDDGKLWDVIDRGNTLALFQFNTLVGGQTVRLLKPRNLSELTAANALMRLMPERGEETPSEKYARFSKDISLWHKEMDEYGLTEHEQKVLEPYLKESHGICYSQEQIMLMVMDEEIAGYPLKDSNALRKLIAKKQMDKIPAARQELIEKATSPAMGKYVWDVLIKPSLGYSFSKIHGMAYSLIACQAAYLASYFPSVYWNTAYLRVVSGMDENDTTNYKKVAKAIGDIQKHGVSVSTIDINKSSYYFEPDEESNSILYGMKALSGVNGDMIQEIESNRPFVSFEDFDSKVKTTKTSMLSLIKSGAFDSFDTRYDVMVKYITQQSKPKSNITMQNLAGLIDKGLVPEQFSLEKRIFVFNKALRANCKIGDFYRVEGRYYVFYQQFFDIDELESVDGKTCIKAKTWQKMYTKSMSKLKKYLSDNQQDMLTAYNKKLFMEQWCKYACGTESKWEMDSLGFYSGQHELANVDFDMYGISDFSDLPEEPVVTKVFRNKYPIYSLARIAGTVIAKDDMKSIFTILTVNDGPIDVRMPRELYALYNRKLSQVDSSGVKKVIEEGWFSKGTLVVVNGFRRGNTFVSKRYKNTLSSILYKIVSVQGNKIIMTDMRAGDCEEE